MAVSDNEYRNQVLSAVKRLIGNNPNWTGRVSEISKACGLAVSIVDWVITDLHERAVIRKYMQPDGRVRIAIVKD
jgi:hypothetical protein